MKKMFKKILLSLIITILSLNIALAIDVVFNTKTLKYHDPNCRWAKKCTENCIKINKEKALKRGGRPCKVCGGD